MWDTAALVGLCVGGGLALLLLGSQLAVCCRSKRGPAVADMHYVITGGSQGLGRALAVQLAAAGAKVTIIARGRPAAEETARIAADAAAALSEKGSSKPLIPKRYPIHVSLGDVTDADAVRAAIHNTTLHYGPVDVLVACAGSAQTGTLFERSVAEHKASMDLNYFGTLNAVYSVLPAMLARGEGSICIVSSALALTSYVGYAAYSPTKYALRGLADTLRNELQGTGVGVHIAYPPNMDTPGYVVEQRTKPAACQEIESSDTVYTPEAIARSILSSLRRGDYNMYCGAADVGVLGVAANGMAPRVNPVLDALLLPWLVVVAWAVRSGWDAAVTKFRRQHPEQFPNEPPAPQA